MNEEDDDQSFIDKDGIAGYLNRNYQNKTIGKEATPYVQSALKDLGEGYQDTMWKARRGMLGPHSFLGAHAIDTLGKIIPDIPIDKGISHGLHNWLGIDKPLANVGGHIGEFALTRKVLKSIPNLVSTKVTPYTKGLNPVEVKKPPINVTPKNSAHLVKKLDGYLGPKGLLQDTFTVKDLGFTPPTVFMSTLDNLKASQRKAALERLGLNKNKKLTDTAVKLGKQKGFIKDEKPKLKKRQSSIDPQAAMHEKITSGAIKYPTISQMTLALRPPKGPEIYKRTDNLTKAEWENEGIRLQNAEGGTDAQRDAFIEQQRIYKENLTKDRKAINEAMKYDYIAFATTAIKEGLLELVGTDIKDLYGKPIRINKIDPVSDMVYALWTRMKQDPYKADILDIGHKRSARVLNLENAGAADYQSNLQLEIRRSIRDWTKGLGLEPVKTKGKPKGWQKGDPLIDKYDWKGGKLIEPGNIYRKDKMEAPKIVDLLLGTSTNIQVEYAKYLGKFNNALDEIIPSELEDAFKIYLTKNWRKWQGRGEDIPYGTRVPGEWQLKRFDQVINKITDDFLNEIEKGGITKGMDKKYHDAKADFESDYLGEALSGKLGQEEYKAAIRRMAREFLEGNREKRKILDNLFSDD